MDDYWKIKNDSKKEVKCSLTNWLSKHWESIVLSIMVGSLLTIAICSIIQLVITWRK